MEKIRLSPSKMVLANRCPFAVALSVMPEWQKVDNSTQIEDKPYIAQGYYFEHMLTGKRPQFREEPKHEAYMNYLDKAHKSTLGKLALYADHLRNLYLKDSMYSVAEFMTWETPEMDVVGELDVRRMDADGGCTIIDVKLLRSLQEVFDPSGKLFDTAFMIQPPTYALLDAVRQSSCKESLYNSAVASLAGDREAYERHLTRFFEGVTPARCAFLACDPKDMGTDVNPETLEETPRPPLHKFLTIEMEPEDFGHLAADYLKVARIIRGMVLAGNQEIYHTLERIIQPEDTRCLGRGQYGKHAGVCPWISSCIYGSRHFGVSSFKFNSLYQ